MSHVHGRNTSYHILSLSICRVNFTALYQTDARYGSQVDVTWLNIFLAVLQYNSNEPVMNNMRDHMVCDFMCYMLNDTTHSHTYGLKRVYIACGIDIVRPSVVVSAINERNMQNSLVQ